MSNTEAEQQVLVTTEKPLRTGIKRMQETSLLSHKELDERKIIYPGIDDADTLNAYRELRTNLLKKANNQNFICMVTSIRSGAGTSHVAMNLAASIALDQRKTALVIDCNIYNPKIGSYLKTPPSLGLTNFLENDTDAITDIIYPSGIPRVRVIPVGNNVINAAEHFSSEQMESFMQSVKTRYPDRFIILDTPPIGLYAESQILVSICDLAILVVGYGKSNHAQIEAGIDTIGKDKLAGLVFNNQ
ncbi:polysaccharide biosynthesis protein [Psychromonas hadalis]|uniref:polysaccharide biosynthesis protein n=1 Tax=Psychromonas hadalis TaxID=211669 RepID=UPI0003B5D337|nr:polysaccharide biosynthesis protein [Psychromonas hadalis]